MSVCPSVLTKTEIQLFSERGMYRMDITSERNVQGTDITCESESVMSVLYIPLTGNVCLVHSSHLVVIKPFLVFGPRVHYTGLLYRCTLNWFFVQVCFTLVFCTSVL